VFPDVGRASWCVTAVNIEAELSRPFFYPASMLPA
jgi:hypothetical protein